MIIGMFYKFHGSWAVIQFHFNALIFQQPISEEISSIFLEKKYLERKFFFVDLGK